MAKLSEKGIGEAKDLLEDYQKICDMLFDVDKRKFCLYLTSEDDKKDFAEVVVRRSGAKALLEAEKEWTAAELKKLGIEV